MDNKEVQNTTNLDQPVVSPEVNPEPAPTPETPVPETPAPEVPEPAPKQEPAPTPEVANSTDSTVSAIANSESRDEQAVVKGQEQTTADFTSMFGVASEEKPEEPKKAVIDIPIKLAPVEETIVREPELTPEQKKANHAQAFNADEKTLYEIRPDKQGNPIVVVVFFCLLVFFIFSLPKISKNQTIIDYFSAGNKKQNTKEKEKEPEYYNLNTATVRAKIGSLELTNFVTSDKIDGEYTLSFTVQNMGDRLYQYDKKYYVVLYDGDQIVYRALIHSYEGVAPKAAQELTLILNERAFKSANRFKLEEIVESEYPEVKIQNHNGNYGVLTCTHNFNTIEYYFFDNKLAKIKEVYREEFDKSTAYTTHKNKQLALHEKYESVPNFDSNFVETNSYFTLVNEFTLADVPDNSLSQLKTYRYFKYNTPKDVVNFEIEAQGYFCS